MNISLTAVIVTIASFVIPIVCGMTMLFVRLSQLHKQMNSRMDELVSVTRTQALAEGKLAGGVEEKAKMEAERRRGRP